MSLIDARDAFDLPDDTVWLNAAYMGPSPRASVEAGARSYARKARPWDYDVETDFFAAPERLRGEAARLFGSGSDDVALVPAVSYGLAVAARNLKLEPGSSILVLDGQFPSNIYAWRRLAARDAARIVTVRRGADESWTDALSAAIGPRTGLVACPHVHWIDGGRVDLETVARIARANGAALALDLTQSLGVLPFDVRAVDPDFAVAAAYKWMLGPYGLGFLYVAPRRQGGEPLEENWINRAGAEDFARLIDYQDGYAPGARRFDMGERSGFQLVPAALEALKLVNGYGPKRLAAHAALLSARLAETAAGLGFTADTPDRAGHYLALTAPEAAPEDLLARLKAAGVLISRRGPLLRVSPHLYNTAEDVDRFAAALETAMDRASA